MKLLGFPLYKIVLVIALGFMAHVAFDRVMARDSVSRKLVSETPRILLEDVVTSVASEAYLVPPRHVLTVQVSSNDGGIARLIVEGTIEPNSDLWSTVVVVGERGNQILTLKNPPPQIRVRLEHQSGTFRAVVLARIP